ncbi:hypothetical protein NVP1193O_054 [Vibrio phage 1.193.O._10N.286.52.C6]|nr:hypothetical protein NVP1193O_054 [Vibrio phage 1.193.O._10N.286.52.C6]
MCYCNKSIRTPCCGKIGCHPPSLERKTEVNVFKLFDSLEDKKQECVMLRDIIAKIPQLIQDSTQEVESHDCWGFEWVEDRVNGEVLAKKLEYLLKEV